MGKLKELEELKQQLAEAKAKIENPRVLCQRTIDRLERELAEAQAHIGVLRQGFEQLRFASNGVAQCANRCLSKTPAQSLAEIKAQAVENAVDTCFLNKTDLLRYAKSIRESE